MGNCILKGFGTQADDDHTEIVKVVTATGGIMEIYAPITASAITDEFPGQGVFRSDDFSAQPLLHNEKLHPNEIYHLLPINPCQTPIKTPSLYRQNSGLCTPYRMSSSEGYQRKKGDDPEAFTRCSKKSGGVWKVNLVISAEELAEILSKGDRTEELIDSARTVAKCGSNGGSSVAPSEHSSTFSSIGGRKEA